MAARHALRAIAALAVTGAAAPRALSAQALALVAHAHADSAAAVDSVRPDDARRAAARRRFRFAQSWIGVAAVAPGPGAHATTQALARAPAIRLGVGGLHFWGRADFYVSVPVPTRATLSAEGGPLDVAYTPGIETGARLFPWPLVVGAVRPFVGVGWTELRYREHGPSGAGPAMRLYRAPVQGGLAWRTGDAIVAGGVEWLPGAGFRYPTSRDATGTASLAPLSAWLGARWALDTTRPLESRQASLARGVRRMRRRGWRGGVMLAAGAATAITASPARGAGLPAPWLSARLPTRLYGDWGIGWRDHDRGLAWQLAWRTVPQRQAAFGAARHLDRAVLALEATRTLGDYHGFAPFVGLSLGHERVRVLDVDGDRRAVTRDRRLVPAAVAGWDIVPARSLPVILRANVRWAPGRGVRAANGGWIPADHVEVGFIQAVVYPGLF